MSLGRIEDAFACEPGCPYCGGDGIVCEDHPLERWEHCGAPGMPCRPKDRSVETSLGLGALRYQSANHASVAPLTTCQLCGTTRSETLVNHLEAHHLNEMFHIEVDPPTGVSVIYGRA